MSPPSIPSIDEIKEQTWGLIWAIGNGGLNSVMEIYESTKYEGPIDWNHIQSLFIQGAIMGFIMWMKLRRTPLAKAPIEPDPPKVMIAGEGGKS